MKYADAFLLLVQPRSCRQDESEGTTAPVEIMRWKTFSGSLTRPGGSFPSFKLPNADNRHLRIAMTVLSLAPRCSLVRSQTEPMLSVTQESWAKKPSMPVKFTVL